MSAPVRPSAEPARVGGEPLLVRLCRAVLARTVRGSAGEGTAWGEAMLAELPEATTAPAAVRWTLSSLPVAWRERRKRRSAGRPPQSLKVRATRRTAYALALLLVGGFVVNLFVATIADEPSASMSPTYVAGSRLLLDKIGYRITGLHDGDVVLVNVPHQAAAGAGTVMIKRIVGLPGDVMACSADGAVTRNGTVVAAPAVVSESTAAPASYACDRVVVPAGSVYVIGDDLSDSLDSRAYGPVAQSAVVGRVVARVWPL